MLRDEKRLVLFKRDAIKRSVFPYITSIRPIVNLSEYPDKHFENQLRHLSLRRPAQQIASFFQAVGYHDCIINEYRSAIIPPGCNSSPVR